MNLKWYEEKLFVNHLLKKLSQLLLFSHDQLMLMESNVFLSFKFI